ncbi:MAG: permease-like cell division protein FtsX [Acidimicrobiia bacterium]|nr:permease-like cell division protein FtsX [Acidimicrobiia bacterium]
MAIRADYLLKETGQNLIRNPSLSLATILTVAVSLSLMGVALLVQQGVGRINTSFKDEVEFIVWLDVNVQQEQIEGIDDFLASNPYVDGRYFIDRDATFQEFQNFFADEPELLQLVEPDQLPMSFQVQPSDTDVDLIRRIGDEIETIPGVQDVEFASDNIRAISTFSEGSSTVMLAAAGAAAGASALLMYNSIRTAVFARRREIEVMRLVGATKWFIRIPFMLEGLLQGLLGALLSIFTVFAVNKLISSFFQDLQSYIFRDFAVPSGQVLTIGGALLVVGALIGAVGAGVAVTRYLDA